MFMNMAGQVRGIDPLLDTFFGFLRRKTDFFQGPPSSDGGGGASPTNGAKVKVLEAFERQRTKAVEQREKERKARDDKKKVRETTHRLCGVCVCVCCEKNTRERERERQGDWGFGGWQAASRPEGVGSRSLNPFSPLPPPRQSLHLFF